MPIQDKTNTEKHIVTRKMILILNTKGILRIIKAVISANKIPSTTLRLRNPNILLDSRTFWGMIISLSFSYSLIHDTPFYRNFVRYMRIVYHKEKLKTRHNFTENIQI